MRPTRLVSIVGIVLAGFLTLAISAPEESEHWVVPPTSPPKGYRDWKLISVAHEAGSLNDIRAVLGNDAAIKASRKHVTTFPDGAIIARLAWSYVPSQENNKIFGHDQSFIAGQPTNVQFMFKDSQEYSSTGGWGFAEFANGEPDNQAIRGACFSCHSSAKAHDFVFAKYAP